VDTELFQDVWWRMFFFHEQETRDGYWPDLGLNTDIPAGIRIDGLRVPPERNFAGRVFIQCYSADFEIPAG
jgi:hypothetical protein